MIGARFWTSAPASIHWVTGVLDAIVAALDEIVHYPDPYGIRLQQALAAQWRVEPDCILVGNGATELIHFVSRVWRDKVTLAVPVFSEFHRAFPDAFLVPINADWPDDGLVVYTNPLNPSGEAIDFRDRRGSHGSMSHSLSSPIYPHVSAEPWYCDL